MGSNIRILSWDSAFQPAFYRLNRAWIEADYPLEPLDIAVLSDPERHILSGGGAILSALAGSEVVGVVALRLVGEKTFELTKMAVDIAWRGQGIGQKLMEAALETAQTLGAAHVILYSNSVTSAPAIRLYRKLGFQEIPLEQGVYKRANIKMEYLVPAYAELNR